MKNDRSDPIHGASRLRRGFGPSLLVALAIVLIVLLTVGRVVPIGPGPTLVLFVVVWFAALTGFLRWRTPSPRSRPPGA